MSYILASWIVEIKRSINRCRIIYSFFIESGNTIHKNTLLFDFYNIHSFPRKNTES